MGPQAADIIGAQSENIPSIDSRFHLHFGAGRLGMGLVVPAISASGIPFAVVQRPKRKWQEMFAVASRGTNENQVGALPGARLVTLAVAVWLSSASLVFLSLSMLCVPHYADGHQGE